MVNSVIAAVAACSTFIVIGLTSNGAPADASVTQKAIDEAQSRADQAAEQFSEAQSALALSEDALAEQNQRLDEVGLQLQAMRDDIKLVAIHLYVGPPKLVLPPRNEDSAAKARAEAIAKIITDQDQRKVESLVQTLRRQELLVKEADNARNERTQALKDLQSSANQMQEQLRNLKTLKADQDIRLASSSSSSSRSSSNSLASTTTTQNSSRPQVSNAGSTNQSASSSSASITSSTSSSSRPSSTSTSVQSAASSSTGSNSTAIPGKVTTTAASTVISNQKTTTTVKTDEPKGSLSTTTTTLSTQEYVASGIMCPVDGANSFTNDWGAPRGGGASHQGTDIFAERGTPVVAPASGTWRISQNTLGGNAFWVTGNDGTKFYGAHLDSYADLSPGAITAGQVIGYVGDTGDAKGTPTHLHFEIHPKGGAAVNPYPTLKVVCR